MKIHLHVGPPKTGTTSLQQALLTHFGAPEPTAIWYPIPERIGPGHADIMQRISSTLYGRSEPTLLDDVARRALAGGCQQLIISSEAGTGLTLSDYWPQLAALSNYGEVRPIVTFQPIGKRIASYWQEMTKHMVGNPLEEARADIARNLMELRLVSALTEMFPERPVSVIFLNADDDSGALFRHFAAITGLQLPDDALAGRAEVVNRSVGRIEADLMAALCQSFRRRTTKGDEYQSARLHLFGMFQTPTWRAMQPRTPIACPQGWVDLLAAHARTTIDGMNALRDAGKVAIFGDVEKFDDIARPYKWPGIQTYKGAPMVAASVILPTSDHGEALRPAVESALKQSLGDLELIIVGTNCDPQTRAVAKELADSDKRIRFQDNEGDTDGLVHLHNAVGEARGRFVAYLDAHGLWLPNHLQTLAGQLEHSDLVSTLHAGLDKNGDLGFTACNLANPDLRHQLATSDQFRFDGMFAGHRVDAYRRLRGGWHTVPADSKWPEAAMWRQFLAEPWCRAVSTPNLTGLSLRTYLRLYLPKDGRAGELQRWQARLGDPGWAHSFHQSGLGFLNSQAVSAQLAQWDAEAQVRGLGAQLQEQQARQVQMADEIARPSQELELDRRTLDKRVRLLEQRLARARNRRSKLKRHWAWRLTRPLRRGFRWIVRG